MTYTPDQTRKYAATREYGWAPLPVRKAPTAALTLAAFSYIPLLFWLAIPALALALTTSGPWEHPVTRERARRATFVALVSLALNVAVAAILLIAGVNELPNR